MSYRELKNDEKIRIAFLFQIASFWPSWESFYHACVADERFEVRLYFVNDGVDTSTQTKFSENFLIEQKMPYIPFSDDDFAAFHPHVAVLQTPYDYHQRTYHLYSIRLKQMGIRVVYIPYGIEIADTKSARHTHFREPVVRQAWRIYTMSDNFAKEYKKYCANFSAVRAFGLPRFDALIDRKRFNLPNEVLKKAKGRKIITWHTHFAKVINTENGGKQVTPYLEEYIKFSENLDKFSDFYFIFLPHPLFGNYVEDHDNNSKSQLILENIAKAENAFIDKSDDYRPSLFADAMITDRSALMVESAVVGIPILYLNNPDYNEAIFPPLQELINSYYHGNCYNDMVKFIDYLRKNNDEKKELRNKMLANCIPFLDGKSGWRVKEDIAVSLKNDVYPSAHNRRIAIFGAGGMYMEMMKRGKFADDCSIVALTDNDSSKWGSIIDENRVISPQELGSKNFDKIIILVSRAYEEQIHKQLLFELEIPQNKIEFREYIATLYPMPGEK